MDEQAIIKDLDNYSIKINAMMIDASSGDCPQSLKLWLFIKMGDFVKKQMKKVNPKSYEAGEKLIKEFLELGASMKCYIPKDEDDKKKLIKKIEENMYGSN